MSATIEDLNIVRNVLTSCKTRQEIIDKAKLPPEIVDEVLEFLRKEGKIEKDGFIFCPIEQVAEGVCDCCASICKDLGGE